MSGPSRRIALVATLVLVASAAVLGAAGLTRQEKGFPHDDHEGLFPVCVGCHEGVESDADAARYPEPALCAECHDGTEVSRVTWTGPTIAPSNVEYRHAEHAGDLALAGDAPLSCEACHSTPDEGRMDVDAGEELATCWGCHAHTSADHMAEGDCAACHAPLAETGFPLDRIEALPLPADHEVDRYVEELHGSDATGDVGRCSTCHTADRCVACHVDADRSEIRAIPFAPTGMALPAVETKYPVPDSHTGVEWLALHGAGAAVGECVTCHTSEDCTACHVSPAPALVEALPRRADVRAPGAMVRSHSPDSHRSVFFMEAHATLAASASEGCATCHTEGYCASCHDAPSNGGYHPGDFVARHSADAYGRDDECATCHSTPVFCRSCHEASGLGAVGRLGPGYHTAEPFWLLRHGQAARQGLESCASCHEQSQCTQCHGALGAFKISPHGAGFDADAAWGRNPRPCLACHVRDPRLGSGT